MAKGMQSLRQLAVAAGMLSALSAVQTASLQAATPTVQVEVTNGGAHVQGLQKEDFLIRLSRKRADVAQVREVDALPRTVVLLFDLSFSRPESIARARELAIAMAPGMDPRDRVALAAHTGESGFTELISPTTDRASLALALRDLALAPGGGSQVRDAVARADGEDLASAQGTLSRHSRAPVQMAQSQVSRLVDSLAGLARAAGESADQTHVVLFSEGFDTSLVLGHPGTTSFDRSRAIASSEAAANGETWRAGGEERYAAGYVESRLFEALALFKKVGARLHTVDAADAVRPSPSQAGARGLDSLYLLAKEANGESYDSSGAFWSEFPALLGAPRAGYMVEIDTRKSAKKARFYQLKIALAKDSADAQLAHRPGLIATP